MSDDAKNDERNDQPPASPGASDHGRPSGDDVNAEAERAFEAGAPGSARTAPDDEVDPELLRMPRPRRRRHPLIALAVIGLSIYLMIFVRQDLVFFLRSRTPVDLGDAAQAVQQGKLQPNSFATLAGTPDRKHALVLEARFGGYETLFRLLQTQNRLFVQQHRETRGSDESLTGSYTGQLIPFRSLPYHRALEAYFAKSVTLAHDLDLRALAAARAQGGRVKDQNGATLQLTADSLFFINVAYPDEWLLQANKSEYPSAEDAVRRLGLSEAGVPFVLDESPVAFWRFVIKADAEQVRALMARLRTAASRPAGADLPPAQNLVRRQVSYTARFDQLSVEGSELVINAADPTAPARYTVEKDEQGKPRLVATKQVPARVPADAVLFISTSSPLRVPADAFVLVTGKRPGENWYYAVLYLVLLAFVVMNAATLIQRLRERGHVN